MKFTQVVPLLFSSLAVAAPAVLPALVPDKTINARAATTVCGQYDSVVTGVYTVYQDLWNEGAATSGSQCSTVDSLSASTIVWSTSWTWAGGAGQVKSYANVALTTTGVQLSAISSIPTVWEYSYTGTSMIADVSYDIFTSSTASGSNEFEIMIWLAALGGAGPISSTGSAIATPTINGVVWNLFSGPNGDTTVYSFVAQTQVTSFSADLLLFFAYLESNEDFSTSQYITTLEAGTEPFSGSDAVLTVSAYSVSISQGTSEAVVSSSTKAAVKATSTAVKVATSSTKATATTTKVATTTAKAITTSTKAPTTVVTKASSTSVKATATTAAASTGGTIAKYYQCGGTGFSAAGTCVSGTTCVYENDYYSQCQ